MVCHWFANLLPGRATSLHMVADLLTNPCGNGFCRTKGLLSGGRAVFFERWTNVGHGLLLQQQFGGLNSGVGVEPMLDCSLMKEVGHREQAHSLVVCHP